MSQRRATTTGRLDLQVIEALVPSGARVLDLGCGDGELLVRLSEEKGCLVYGIEIDERAVRGCIQWGVPIFHGDMLEGMGFFPDQTFDLVILSQTLQQVLHPAQVIHEMLRVGRRAIVSFPNFGYWRTRLSLLGGKSPARYGLLSDPTSQTPNVHLCTLRDFHSLCVQGQLRMESEILLTPAGQRVGGWLAGWRADVVICLLTRGQLPVNDR